MNAWADFCVAQIGASAALAGLVFVGVSINLANIMASAQLPGRALGAVLSLATVLAECSVLLAPRQSPEQAGVEILLLSLALCMGMIVLQRDTYHKAERQYRRHYLRQIALSQVAVLMFVIAGAWVLLLGEDGFIWFLPGALLSYLVALTEAWVLLIEIKR